MRRQCMHPTMPALFRSYDAQLRRGTYLTLPGGRVSFWNNASDIGITARAATRNSDPKVPTVAGTCQATKGELIPGSCAR